VSLAHISILLQVIHRALPGGSDKIILYYCLMVTWTGLDDNTELFCVVLSQDPPFEMAAIYRFCKNSIQKCIFEIVKKIKNKKFQKEERQNPAQ
jgi:hypothetical protein